MAGLPLCAAVWVRRAGSRCARRGPVAGEACGSIAVRPGRTSPVSLGNRMRRPIDRLRAGPGPLSGTCSPSSASIYPFGHHLVYPGRGSRRRPARRLRRLGAAVGVAIRDPLAVGLLGWPSPCSSPACSSPGSSCYCGGRSAESSQLLRKNQRERLAVAAPGRRGRTRSDPEILSLGAPPPGDRQHRIKAGRKRPRSVLLS